MDKKSELKVIKEQFLLDWDEGDTDNRPTVMELDLDRLILSALESSVEQTKESNVFLIHQTGNETRLYKNGIKVSPSEFTEFYGCEMTDEQKKVLNIIRKNYIESLPEPKELSDEEIRSELTKFAALLNGHRVEEEITMAEIDEYLAPRQEPKPCSNCGKIHDYSASDCYRRDGFAT